MLRQEQKAATTTLEKIKARTFMLQEMTELIRTNPLLIEEKSDTKLARSLSEASPRELTFLREYVHKYREVVKDLLRL